MTSFVYIHGASSALAERWLRAHGDADVVLLADGDCVDRAREARDRHGCVSEIVNLADAGRAALSDRVSRDGSRVVLPMSFDTMRLRFIPSANMPLMGPHYPLFRRLWRLGFRRFEVSSLGGSQCFEIPHLLDEFTDRHKRRRCFVIGNGPSLRQLEMPRLANEITFGSNRGYLGFEQWGFSFNYWGVSDWLQIEEYGAEYEKHIPAGTVAFHPFEYLPLLKFANGCPVNMHAYNRPAFSGTCDVLDVGHSVTYSLMQIAAIMGCDPIILIGVDHRYDLKKGPWLKETAMSLRNRIVKPLRGTPFYKSVRAWREARAEKRNAIRTPEFWRTADASSPTHFDERYSAGKKFLMPEPEEAERDYACARLWAEANGVTILNATPESALTVFPTIAWEDLF